MAVVVPGDTLPPTRTASPWLPGTAAIVSRDASGAKRHEGVEHDPAGEPDLLVQRERGAPDVRAALGDEALDVVTEPRDVDVADVEPPAVLDEQVGGPVEARRWCARACRRRRRRRSCRTACPRAG